MDSEMDKTERITIELELAVILKGEHLLNFIEHIVDSQVLPFLQCAEGHPRPISRELHSAFGAKIGTVTIQSVS